MGRDGDATSISAIDIENGSLIRTFTLHVPVSTTAGDRESMSVGPCDSTGSKTCIYVPDNLFIFTSSTSQTLISLMIGVVVLTWPL